MISIRSLYESPSSASWISFHTGIPSALAVAWISPYVGSSPASFLKFAEQPRRHSGLFGQSLARNRTGERD